MENIAFLNDHYITYITDLNQQRCLTDSYILYIQKFFNQKYNLAYLKLTHKRNPELNSSYCLENEKNHNNFFEEEDFNSNKIKSVNNESSNECTFIINSFNKNFQQNQLELYYNKNYELNRINISSINNGLADYNFYENNNESSNEVTLLIPNFDFFLNREISQQIQFELYYSLNQELDRVNIFENNTVSSNNTTELSNPSFLNLNFLSYEEDSRIQKELYYSNERELEHEINIIDNDNILNNNQNDDINDDSSDVDMVIL